MFLATDDDGLLDGDGVPNDCDPCPVGANDDSDGDGSCDIDDICPGFDDGIDNDGDGVADGYDVCPDDPLNQVLPDGTCGVATVGDPADDDGFPDACDVCPLDADDSQGSADAYADGDSVCDAIDQCEDFDDAIDGDEDGIPDACDPCPFGNPNDSDGDGVCDSDDICPGGDDQVDPNNNGILDDCEDIDTGETGIVVIPPTGDTGIGDTDSHTDILTGPVGGQFRGGACQCRAVSSSTVGWFWGRAWSVAVVASERKLDRAEDRAALTGERHRVAERIALRHTGLIAVDRRGKPRVRQVARCEADGYVLGFAQFGR